MEDASDEIHIEEVTDSKFNVLCDGNRLVGGVAAPADARALVLFIHGIPSVAPEDPADGGYPALAGSFARAGYVSAWIDLRGKRGGYFSIEGWVRDLAAALDATRTIAGAERLKRVVVGSSAGGAVAVEAARRGAPIDALALLGTPATWVSFAGSPADAVARITEGSGMPLAPDVLADPTQWAAEFDAVTPERSIAQVKVPMLILHGTADDVVPVEHAHRLGERAARAEVHVIEGGVHQLRRDQRAIEILQRWLKRVT